ncbi:hypothetical protein GCM10020295_32210 [Streptomyces cinereospinus]
MHAVKTGAPRPGQPAARPISRPAAAPPPEPARPRHMVTAAAQNASARRPLPRTRAEQHRTTTSSRRSYDGPAARGPESSVPAAISTSSPLGPPAPLRTNHPQMPYLPVLMSER